MNEKEGINILNGDLPVYVLEGHVGDVFNMVVHSSKRLIGKSYYFMCAENQIDLVTYLVSNYKTPPIQIISVSNVWGSIRESFEAKNKLPGGIVQPKDDKGGPKFLWADPSDFDYLMPLEKKDIDSWINFFCETNLEKDFPNMSVVFFTKASPNIPIKINIPFDTMVPELKKMGLENIFANVSGHKYYGDETVPGATSINLTLREIISMVYRRKKSILLIGLRSGIFDCFRFSKSFSCIFYDSSNELLYKSWRLGNLVNRNNLQEILLGYGEPESYSMKFMIDFAHCFVILNRKHIRFKDQKFLLD